MKFLQILSILILTHNYLLAQIPAPNFQCVKRDTLIWTPPSVSCGSITGYTIFAARNPDGPYQILTTINNATQTRYFHNNTEGGNWYYYMETNALCTNSTKLKSDTLDNQPPSLTSVLTLNVINNQTVEVRWRKNPTPEVVGYIIYKKTASGLIPYANIPSRDTIRYLDTNASPNLKSEEYQVLAVDACGSTSLFDVNHQTILVKATQSKCEQSITLKWNLYQNWANSIAKQEVWVGIAGRNPILYATLGAKDSTYTFKNAKNKTTYVFYIKAIESVSNISSKSNDTTVIADISEPVKELLLKNLTVNRNNKVELTWKWNDNANIDTVEIFRRPEDSSSFRLLKSYNPTLPLDEQGFYNDDNVNAGTRPYYYYLKTTDACKVKVNSKIGGTVFLQGVPFEGGKNYLKWTPFYLEGATITGYQVVRIVNGAGTDIGSPIGPDAPKEYYDLSTTGDKNICYRVGAMYKYKLADGSEEEAISYSNTICIAQFSNVWVPNAFTPNGKNPLFRPVFTFYENVEQYQMYILDRWGTILYQTSNPIDGWDGRYKNNDMPQGAYTYIVRLKQSSGGLYENKGVLMLIR